MELSQILYIKLTLDGVMFHLVYLSVIGQLCCYGYCLKILILYLGPVHILSKILKKLLIIILLMILIPS